MLIFPSQLSVVKRYFKTNYWHLIGDQLTLVWNVNKYITQQLCYIFWWCNSCNKYHALKVQKLDWWTISSEKQTITILKVSLSSTNNQKYPFGTKKIVCLLYFLPINSAFDTVVFFDCKSVDTVYDLFCSFNWNKIILIYRLEAMVKRFNLWVAFYRLLIKTNSIDEYDQFVCKDTIINK